MGLLVSGIQSCRCGLRTSTLGVQYQNLSRLVCSDGKDGLCLIRRAEKVRIAEGGDQRSLGNCQEIVAEAQKEDEEGQSGRRQQQDRWRDGGL